MEAPARHATRIAVQTAYLQDQSDPERQHYVFAYTITITNTGRVAATLMRRHWIITDANGRVQEVRGEGVVGQQPRLDPGATFRYTSGAILETPVGCMEGSYQMVGDDGVEFEAPIAPFNLSLPRSLH